MNDGFNKGGKKPFKGKPNDLFSDDEDISINAGWEYLNRLARVKPKPNFAKIKPKKKGGSPSNGDGDAKGGKRNSKGQSKMDF